VKDNRLLGVASTIIGLAMLVITFVMGYVVLTGYRSMAPSTDLATSMGILLYAAIQVLFLGVMGWVGSLLMLRGIDLAKVDKGVGVVTFTVDKGVGIMTQQKDESKTSS